MLYQDEIDFYTALNGLYEITNLITNYTVYQSDATTTIDLSISNVANIPAGDGPDPLSRDTDQIFINYLFEAFGIYYLKYIPPLSGLYGVYSLGD